MTVNPVTSALGSLQGTTGLVGGKSIATLTQAGGISTDSFAYTVGGTASSSFTVSSSGVLTTASGGVTGGTNGRLYAITVTAHDNTNGTSSPAVPVNVIAGGSSADTIANLSGIIGLVATAPTFIYGLASADTIDASTLSGPVYIDSGAGADTLTGSTTAATVFEFGATSDSTPTVMDVINGFNVSLHKIDLTGIGGGHFTSFTNLSASATSINKNTIGWEISNGNTYVYVNNTSRSQNLSSASMEIKLTGLVSLTSGNVLHN